jgi:4'-phosphopantetheinyl transferase
MFLDENIFSSVPELLNCPTLQIFMKHEWGSKNPSHRELIRTELSELLSDRSKFTSISHCPDMGIVIAANAPVGVDVEITSRVESKIVARVSSDREVVDTTSAAALWCAKESSFKALQIYDQPSVVSAISIGDWKKIDSQTETFRMLNTESFKAPASHKGVIIKSQFLTFSFFAFLT